MLSQKGSVTIIVLIVFLLTLGGAVWYFTNFPIMSTPVGEPQTSGTKEAIKSSIQQVNLETVSWQTYKNEKYDYEIKYPPGMKVTGKPQFNIFSPLADYDYDTFEIATVPQNTDTGSASDFQANNFQEVLDYVDKETNFKQEYKEVTAFNGYDAASFIPKNVGGSASSNIFIFHKPHVLWISFMYRDDEDKRERYKMTQKILSTFKFTN